MTSDASTPMSSASLLVATRDGTVLVGQRALALPFLGGYLSFPGGRVEAEDRALAGELLPDDPLGVEKIAALREMEEEASLTLLGSRAERFTGPFAERARRVDFSRFVPAGRWITPPYSPVRFDTQFFLYEVDGYDAPTADDEFEWLRFESAATLIESWSALEHVLTPPALVALECLRFGTQGAPRRILAFPGARGEGADEFEALPDVRILALRTPTLPPADTTNTVVIGREKLLIVDPATYERDERDKLLAHLEPLIAGGASVEGIVLTHHHVDHVGAASWLAEKLKTSIIAHPITRDLVAPKIRVDRTVEDGDRLRLGRDARGAAFEVEVLFTPGHAPGHIVLVDRRPGARLAIVGDMVAAIGTIIVDPPEGNMAEYLRQLRRLAALPNMILVPAHGPPIIDGHQKLAHYVAHRLAREQKVLDALDAHGEGTPFELLDVAYADTPSALHALAARSCLAHLEKLVEDGRAVQRGDRFARSGLG